MKGELCAGCKGLITADPANPGPGVLRHVRSTRHQAWRIGYTAEPVPSFLPTPDGQPVMRFSPAERLGHEPLVSVR